MSDKKIKIIDSVMGSGKSTYAINYINDNIDENFIIVVPTKSEQQRYKKALDRAVFLPNLDDCADRLLQSFNWAVEDGKTIVTTHKLLECWDSTSITEIKKRDYTLILDEVIDVVMPISIHKNDFELLESTGLIQLESVPDKEGLHKIKAVQGKEYEGKLKHFLEQVRHDNVFQVNDKFHVWLASAEKLQAFDDVFVLTYMFNGQQLKGWLEVYDIPYILHSIAEGQLVSYQKSSGLQFKNLITVNEDKALNAPYSRYGSLSVSDYEKSKPAKISKLRNGIRSFLRSHSGTDARLNLVTTFKSHETVLLREPFLFCVAGVKRPKLQEMTAEDKAERYCFSPYNTKATNLYRHKAAVAYPVNIFPRPEIEHFFKRHLSGHDSTTFKDLYALSTMIQFIWRSRIRDGLPIDVYVPSKRMRGLLQDWLNDDLLSAELT